MEIDWRRPENRLSTFLKFYAFHLRYKAHPGCVYYVMPWLAKRYNLGDEEKLWFAYINGNTQNPVTSWIIFQRYRSPEQFVKQGGKDWFNESWNNLQWDADRRYQKKDFPANVDWYHRKTALEHPGQIFFFDTLMGSPPLTTDRSYVMFRNLWCKVLREFPSFGRLASFSYTEYLKIMGLPIECDSLFFEDISGSASHRNGLCLVMGRDDLISDKKVLGYQGHYGKYTSEEIGVLEARGFELLKRATEVILGEPDISYFTLESTLCTYKSWHKRNRRYPNVYNDMLHDRIKWAEEHWPTDSFEMFWECREESLPEYLRLECNPNDPGLSPEKQNYYLDNGVPVMMSKDFPEFDNPFDRSIWN